MERNRKMQYGRRIGLLLLITVAATAIYILWGIDNGSIEYNLLRRIKIVAAVLLVSYAVGHSTLIFQTITNNRILTPGIMGLDSLYMFFQTVVVFFMGSRTLAMMSDIPSFFATLAMMVFAAVLMFFLLFRGEKHNVYFLVLVGMIFGTFFSGLSNFMQMLIDPNEYSILQGKMFASFNKINVDLLLIAAIIIVIVFIVGIPDLRKLDVLSLGRNNAINLGVDYKRLVLKSLILVAVLTSVATVLVGPISFLGILVISLVRSLLPTFSHRMLLPATWLVAVTILMVGMAFTERIMKFAVPLSVIVNFVGGLYFIILLLKENRVKT